MHILIGVVVVAILALGTWFFVSQDEEVTVAVQEPANELPLDETLDTSETATFPVSDEPLDPNDPAVSGLAPEGDSREPAEEVAVDDSGKYNDGTYTVDTSYTVPNGTVHDMAVTFDVQDDAIVAVSIVFDGNANGSTSSQSRFTRALNITGTDIDDVDLSRVGGSSLTTDAFNEAVDTLKQVAA